MSFGKNSDNLKRSFQQQARTQARRTTGGSGGAPYWKGAFAPSDYAPGVIRLIPGDYPQALTRDKETIVTESLTYVQYREHHNGNRGCICSGGPLWAVKGKNDECPSCTVYWEDVNERKAKKARGDTTKGPNRMSCRDMYVFNVWDYNLYFEMPETDRSGNPRMNNKTGAPFTHWVSGDQNDPRFQGRPWKQGNLMPWPMGSTYKDTLVNYADQVGQSCTSCGGRDTIRCIMKICGNPACGQYIYDPQNNTLTAEQRKAIDDFPYKCPHCGQETWVDEVIECSGCQNPTRASIFDVDLQVQRMGTKGQLTFLQIFNHSEPRPIQVDAETLKTIVPLDLLKKYQPHDPATQRKIMKLAEVVPMVGAPPPMVGQQQPLPPAAQPGAMPGPTMGAQPPMQQPPQYAQPPMAPQPMAQPPVQQPMQQLAQPPMQPPPAAPPTAPQPPPPQQQGFYQPQPPQQAQPPMAPQPQPMPAPAAPQPQPQQPQPMPMAQMPAAPYLPPQGGQNN
jgi:hypothetical protein